MGGNVVTFGDFPVRISSALYLVSINLSNNLCKDAMSISIGYKLKINIKFLRISES